MRNGHFRPQRRQQPYSSGDEMPATSTEMAGDTLSISNTSFTLLGTGSNRAIFDTSKYPFDKFKATLVTGLSSTLNETITAQLRDTLNGQSYPDTAVSVTSASREPAVSDFATVTDRGVIEFGIESKVSATAITGTVFSARVTLWGVV